MLFALYMPNKPETMRWVSDIEREQLIYRLAEDRGTIDEASDIPLGTAIKRAFTDPKMWLLCITLTVAYVAAAVTNFCESPQPVQ